MNELQLIAAADQINAAHRDALAAFRRFRDIVATSADRGLILSEMPAIDREVLAGLADEDGDSQFAALLREHRNA